MQLSHINITMPEGHEEIARSFYSGNLGLHEIPKPEQLRVRGGVWFDAGGLDIHVSVEKQRFGPDAQRHFGIECADVDALRAKLKTAGVETDDGRPAPWKRFFVRDPFGNRIEIHEPGGLRA
jgi:catechol 2,3-dioxygenase-like lactoylglutathione lyase family enzyme